jgi:hypothetical protein
MADIVVATEEQIEEIVFKAISRYFSENNKEISSTKLPDTLNLSGALKVLEEHGFPTSKAKLYKMTSLGQIPFMKYGNKLVFSRKSLVKWAHEQLVSGNMDRV